MEHAVAARVVHGHEQRVHPIAGDERCAVDGVVGREPQVVDAVAEAVEVAELAGDVRVELAALRVGQISARHAGRLPVDQGGGNGRG